MGRVSLGISAGLKRRSSGSVSLPTLVPSNTVLPAIFGTPTEGQVLSSSVGTWTESPYSYSRQWRRNGVDIAGATSANYTLVSADVGATITLAVIATNIIGSSVSAAVSAGVGPVVASGGSYPAIVTTRSLQSVWDITAANTGPRTARTSTATNSSGTSTALPSGASYITDGSQRAVLVTGSGVTFSNWKFEIPVMVVNGATSAATFTDCEWTAAGHVAGYGMLYIGYQRFATTVHESSSAVVNYCSFAYTERGSVPPGSNFPAFHITNGMRLDASNQTLLTSLTLTNSRLITGLGALLHSKGLTTATGNFFGGHGLHPTATTAELHSEAIYAFWGTLTATGNKFDGTESRTVRTNSTYTAEIFCAAEYGTLNFDINGNIMREIGEATGDDGSAMQFQITGTGFYGDARYWNNIQDKTTSAYYVLSGVTGSDFDKIIDNFDLETGARITQVTEVSGGADTTAPTLSSPTSSSVASTTATAGVTTNEANGTLYYVRNTSATTLTAAAIKSGATGNQAIGSTGAKTVNLTGLTDSTTYYVHWMHEDAAGNQSNVVQSSFTTTAASTSYDTVSFARSATPPYVQRTGYSLGSNGSLLLFAMEFMMPSVTAGTIIPFGTTSGPPIQVKILTTGRMRFTVTDTTGAEPWSVDSTNVLTAGVWYRVLVKFDTTKTTAALGCQIRINGADERGSATWDASGTKLIGYATTRAWYAGTIIDAADGFVGSLRFAGIKAGYDLDLSVQGNRDLFDAGNAGVGGTNIGGIWPIWLTGPAADWNGGTANKGDGGAFTKFGSAIT